MWTIHNCKSNFYIELFVSEGFVVENIYFSMYRKFCKMIRNKLESFIINLIVVKIEVTKNIRKWNLRKVKLDLKSWIWGKEVSFYLNQTGNYWTLLTWRDVPVIFSVNFFFNFKNNGVLEMIFMVIITDP